MLDNGQSEIELAHDDFVAIRDFILEKSGIYFAENKKYLLKNRLVRRMNELQIKTFRDYLYTLKYDTSLKEFHNLMNVVTTNETSFFRNPPQLLSFADEVVPAIVKRKSSEGGPQLIKLWSAGCSTGEEPYTLSMILSEALGAKPSWRFEITANDISSQVLAGARRGVYQDISFRTPEARQRARFFDRRDDGYHIREEIKRPVNFSLLNLSDPTKLRLMRGMDVIFCRNVMIYFSDEVKRQIVRGFYEALVPGGYLFIGHSESLHGISKAFKLVYFKSALVYRREPAGAGRPTAAERPDKAADSSTLQERLARINKTLKKVNERTKETPTSSRERVQEILARRRA